MLITAKPAIASDPALVRQGYNYINKGYIKNAIPAFQKAVKQYPDNARAHYGLAISAYKQGGDDNFKLAEEHFRTAIKLDPTNIEAKAHLARILSWNPSNRQEALDLYKDYLSTKPDDNNIRYQYAETLNWAGKSSQAAEILADLYKSSPVNKDITINYANALASSEQYNAAFGIFQQAIKAKYQFDNFTSLNYARTLQKTGNDEMAIVIYQDVLKRAKSPDEIRTAQKDLAGAYFDSGKYQNAIEIDQSIDNKDKDILLRMARSNQRLNNQQEAIKLYEDLYNTYPYDIEIKRSTADYLAGVGGYTINASKIYEEILDEGYGTLKDKINLANIYNTRENTRARAVNLYREILQDPGLISSEASKIKLDLARALASNEQTRPEAIQLYRQLLSHNDSDLQLKLELLEILSWQEATRREALTSYYELYQQYPTHPKIENGFNQTLVWYLPERSDLPFYEEIIQKHPDNPNALKGLAYLVSQHPDIQRDVVGIYKKALASDPGNIDLQMKLANHLASNKETRDDAIKMYRQILNKDSNNLEVKAELANNLLYERKFKEAKELYNEILNQTPDNRDALLGKARIYGWQGLNLAALKAYEKAYSNYPADPDIAYEYAGIAKKLGNNAKALQILKSIKDKSYLPEAPTIPEMQQENFEIAMAINYQALSGKPDYSGNIMPDTNDIERLQNDLASMERELQQLEKELSQLQSNNKKTIQNIEQANKPANTHYNSHNSYSDYPEPPATDYTASTATNNTSSPFDHMEVSADNTLPEPPVKPSQEYSGRVHYTPTISVLDELKNENSDRYNEIVLNSDEGSMPNIFRISGFEDALSGRRYDIMEDQFGQLEKDIMYLMRPELRTGFMLSNEAGNPTSDALEVHGFPSFMSVNITPQNRFRFGVSSMTYGMTTSVHPASITATSYTMGLNSRPHERVMFDGDLTINSFSDPNAPVDVTANADLSLRLHDRLKLDVGYRREPLYQSVFETTGYTLRPQYSQAQLLSVMNRMAPFAGRWIDMDPNLLVNRNRLRNNPAYYHSLNGPFMGQVRDNAVGVDVTFLPFNKWDLSAGYEYSAVRGENIEHNSKHQTYFSIGRTFTGVKDHLFRLGYQFLFFGYRKDLSAFPNMTPYPYTVNGRNIPVTRQMTHEEINRYLNDADYPYVDPRVIYESVTNGTPIPPAGEIYSSPVRFIAAPDNVGIGGYFSPTQFYLNSFRLDFEGKLANGRIMYKGGGSLGVQQIGDRVGRMDLLRARHLEQYANIRPGDPRLADNAFRANARAARNIQDNTDPTSLASAFDFTLFLRVTDFLTIYNGVDYMNTGAFDRWRYNGGIILRPNIEALSPLFRKPQKASADNELEDISGEDDTDIIETY